MAVSRALTRFPQIISGLLPELGKERKGLWSSFPGSGLDAVGVVSDFVVGDSFRRRGFRIWPVDQAIAARIDQREGFASMFPFLRRSTAA